MGPRVDNNNEDVLIHVEKCTGCLNCQLICSFTFTGMFNPSAAWIIIDRENGGRDVRFSEECTSCNLCVKHCVYGTLTLREEGG